jgi:hypothetical protein
MSYATEHVFHYAHLLSRKPAIEPPSDTRTITCVDCQVQVETVSRLRKRCDACALAARERRDARKDAKAKAQRAARKGDSGRASGI